MNEEELRRSLATCVCECSILKQQRDELLAALEYLLEEMAELDANEQNNDAVAAARAAIAKVKEQSC